MPDHGNKFYYVLGTYERELHETIEMLCQRPFQRIVNVGAGDGYYAVGLALRIPAPEVTAFEMPRSWRYLEQIALINGIVNRFTIAGICDHEMLREAVGDGRDCLLFMDCEGDEVALLDPSTIPALRNCTILVEAHDFVHKNASNELRRKFEGVHAIKEIRSHPRTIDELPFKPDPDEFTEELKKYWISSIDENRPVDMSWFCMEPR
jgi:hypothetical protein